MNSIQPEVVFYCPGAHEFITDNKCTRIKVVANATLSGAANVALVLISAKYCRPDGIKPFRGVPVAVVHRRLVSERCM